MKAFDETINPNAYLTYNLSSEYSVFSEEGRENLLDALTSRRETSFAAVFVCEPISVLFVCAKDCFFLIDTHPIHKVKQRNGNEIQTSVIVQADATIEGITQICKWLWKRLYQAGVEDAKQALSLFYSM